MGDLETVRLKTIIRNLADLLAVAWDKPPRECQCRIDSPEICHACRARHSIIDGARIMSRLTPDEETIQERFVRNGRLSKEEWLAAREQACRLLVNLPGPPDPPPEMP